jgi:hypothetical protein
MSSLFLNGLYTTGINALSQTSNLLIGGTNTNNIQILSPIIGDSSNNLTFSFLNTSDIVNTITQNFCFNSVIPSASISVTNNSNMDDTSITLDASNIIINGNLNIYNKLVTTYNYNEITGTTSKGSIGYTYYASKSGVSSILDDKINIIVESNNIPIGVYYAKGVCTIDADSGSVFSNYELSFINSEGYSYFSNSENYNFTYSSGKNLSLLLHSIIIVTSITNIQFTIKFKGHLNGVFFDITNKRLFITRIA